MKKRVKILLVLGGIIFFLLLVLFFVRLISPREIDDVSPNIFCSNQDIKKSNILWVIPKFNNQNLSENKAWCEYILSLNKTLGLHGVYHEYNEFGKTRDKKYIQEGINEFEKCFGFKPTMFKPPQLNISLENKKLIKENGLILRGEFNQMTHKVYHCNDTGLVKNRLIDWF